MHIVLGLDLIQQGGACFLKSPQIFSTLGLFIHTLLELGLCLLSDCGADQSLAPVVM